MTYYFLNITYYFILNITYYFFFNCSNNLRAKYEIEIFYFYRLSSLLFEEKRKTVVEVHISKHEWN